MEPLADDFAAIAARLREIKEATPPAAPTAPAIPAPAWATSFAQQASWAQAMGDDG